MRKPRATEIIEALIATLKDQIGADETWCTQPRTIRRAINAPTPESLPRPAIIVMEPEWENQHQEVAGSDELGVADLKIQILLLSDGPAMAAAIGDTLHGLAEDVLRAVRQDFQLAKDDPDNPGIGQWLLAESFMADENLSIVQGFGIAKLVLAGKIDFLQLPTEG